MVGLDFWLLRVLHVYRTEEVCYVHPLPQRDIEMVVEHKESVARLERNDQ